MPIEAAWSSSGSQGSQLQPPPPPLAADGGKTKTGSPHRGEQWDLANLGLPSGLRYLLWLEVYPAMTASASEHSWSMRPEDSDILRR
ncbi:hypothetical protein HGM15179_019556, partial [Zosterops borbonicus]